jgi:AraC-like DNA-binding protein
MHNEFHYEFVLNDLMNYAAELSRVEGFSVQNNIINYPDKVAIGSSKFYKISEYISFQLVNYTAQQKMVFKMKPSFHNHVAITFQDFTFAKSTGHDYGCNEIVTTNNKIGSVLCKSTKIEENVIILPGMHVKLILILLKEGWVDNILLSDVNTAKFHKYMVHAQANLRKQYLGPEQRKLFNEIFEKRTSILLEHLYDESRVLNLLQTFLSDVLTKDDEEESFVFSSEEDIRMMQLAEKYITDNLLAPFPGVDQLSRISLMSRTKFITLFNKVYGLSSFEYYQQKRLSIAYELLKTGKYSIGDVAGKIGYSGINNFATAFKKEFGLMPRDLLYDVKSSLLE